MAEIDLNPETPTQAVVKAANQTVTVVDAQGRRITIKRLKTLDRMRLLSLVGSDNAKNEQYFGYAALGYSVIGIDGDPVVVPTTLRQLEAIVQRLDDDGFNAVAKGMAENFISPDEADIRQEVKNG